MNITYKSNSRLERVLRSGRFAVTAELNPPDSADPQEVYDAAVTLAAVCDAINATDASGANCHMSSVAICALLVRAGVGWCAYCQSFAIVLSLSKTKPLRPGWARKAAVA